jgi:ABC-type multidrug transport system ATPase subunit
MQWNVIAEVTVGRCVILTTHSMEECEALCSRIGIMVGGQLKCLGSSQHLKSKFGNGYEIQMNFRLGGLDESRELLADTFPTMIVQEQVGDFVRINVSEMNDLASAFGTLQHQKDTGLVLDYSIAQCSLEQVFVSFAGAAKTDDGI